MESGVFEAYDKGGLAIQAKKSTHENCAGAGLVLLILGFLVQLVGNWL